MFFVWAESGRSAGFAGYGHFAWTLQDGSPADIWAMAQSDDGYLWLATGFGLYRFDGVRFERFRPRSGGALPSTNITAITILPSGDKWIGYYHGGLTRLRGSDATHYRIDTDVPSGMVYRIVADAEGGLWAVIGASLLRFDGARWRVAGASDGYRHGKAYWMELDHAGALWVAGEHTILVRQPGQPRFQDTGIAVAPQAILAVSRQGEMWLSDARRGTRPIRHIPQGYHDAVEEFPELSAVQAARLLFLPDGSLWGTRRGRGLFRTALPGADSRMGGAVGRTSVQFFHKADGLTSDIAVPLFADREGNLWVGTILGLNRFRYRNVVALPAALATPGGFDQVIHGDDGGVVVVSSTGTMLPIDRDVMQRLLDGGALSDEVARSRPTTWWLGEGDGLWHVERGQVTRHAFPGEPDGVITDAMLVDARRRIWLAVRGRGVFVRDSADWSQRIEFSSPTPVVMAAGQDERVWLGYKEGGIAVVDDERIEAFAADATLAVGAITALHPRQQDVVIAGELGIAHFDGTRFRSFLEEPALFGVTGILEDADGFLWLNGSRGVARVHSTELARAKGGEAAALNPVLFDQIDGLPGVALQAKAVPSVASAEGLLWFSTNGGVAMIDPERVRANDRPPDVHVLSVSSASTVLDGATGGSLPPGAGTVRIAYTATSLSAPERVQFRYRIDGLDKDWNEAGGRREAVYTNLRPGNYRFHVIAANNDGVWNQQGARVEFSIRPTFFQSGWFVFLCILAVVMALLAAYLSHMRQLAIRMQTRVEERHVERERIARELHDTLLQSVQGLILGLHALSRRAGGDATLQQDMTRMTDRAESVLIEGRDRVSGLRTVADSSSELTMALALLGSEIMTGRANLQVAANGRPRKLPALVRDELYSIAREAIINADRHADAGRISVIVDYGNDALRVLAVDDGCGIPHSVLESGQRSGHWGLAGMRERIKRIGGILEIHASAETGTSVCATVPRARAYADPLPYWLAWLRARFRARTSAQQ